jgi:hypothetical protein
MMLINAAIEQVLKDESLSSDNKSLLNLARNRLLSQYLKSFNSSQQSTWIKPGEGRWLIITREIDSFPGAANA